MNARSLGWVGAVSWAVALAGCGGSEDSAVEPAGPEPLGAKGDFALETPDIELAAGEERTDCYFTTLKNAAGVGVRGYRSAMTEGSHHLILFYLSEPLRPDGTLEPCSFTSAQQGKLETVPVWAYASQEETGELALPRGVGVGIAPDQPVLLQAHYLNSSDAKLTARARVEVFAHAEGAAYTPASAFVTFSTEIAIPAGANGSTAGSCEVPADASFFLLSTHSHRFTTSARVRDGAAVVIETNDWEHPAVGVWSTEPYRFGSGSLRYECEYHNPTPNEIKVGDSAETDEMCMAIGYYYPAEGTTACLDDFVIDL
jgi:hypothetical protein